LADAVDRSLSSWIRLAVEHELRRPVLMRCLPAPGEVNSPGDGREGDGRAAHPVRRLPGRLHNAL